MRAILDALATARVDVKRHAVASVRAPALDAAVVVQIPALVLVRVGAPGVAETVPEDAMGPALEVVLVAEGHAGAAAPAAVRAGVSPHVLRHVAMLVVLAHVLVYVPLDAQLLVRLPVATAVRIAPVFQSKGVRNLEIASMYEIASANLAIALQTDTVSSEQRLELQTAIGNDIDKLIDCLNMIIVCYNRRMYSGEIAADKAAKSVKAEYAAIGLSKVVSYDFFAPAVELFFDRKSMTTLSAIEKLDRIKEISAQNERCSCQRVRDALHIYCLRLMSHMGIVTVDLAFTRDVMQEINAITEERKNVAIMPQALITEL